MATRRQAERVARKLALRYREEPWLRSVGPDDDGNDGFLVSIHVARTPDARLPSKVDGVKVTVVVKPA